MTVAAVAPLRVGIIGTGYFARFQIAAWRRLDGVELVALCDLDPERLASAGELAPDAARCRNADELLALPLDLVDVATPPATHQALIAMCAARGVDVVCQKPLAPDYAGAVAVVETAERAGIRLTVHENFRFMPWHQELRRLLNNGALGKLHGVSARLRPGDGQGPDAYLARQPYFQDMPRFLIHETAIHHIDTFRYLCGEVTGVFARLRRLNPAIRGEDAGHVLFEFADGVSGLFDGNRLNDHPSDNPRLTLGELWLEGEHGVLRLDGYGRLWRKPHGEPEAEHRYDWQDRDFGGDCVYNTQKHIVERLRAGLAPDNSGRDYLQNLRVEEAVYRSADSGRWQTPESI